MKDDKDSTWPGKDGAAQGNNCTNPPHFPPHCGCPAG